jgi:Trk K+ transport system NAD-binding subunit
MFGLRIRDLHLPQDVIILSLKRKGNTVITHGYTQLRKADVLTFVGSNESLEKVIIMFEN